MNDTHDTADPAAEQKHIRLLEGLAKWRARQAEQRALGISPPTAPRNAIEVNKAEPLNRKKAVRAYWWQMENVIANQGRGPDGELQRLIAEAGFAKAKEERERWGWVAVIRAICFGCVGGDPEQPDKPDGSQDLAPRTQIKKCDVTSCALHQVRAWRSVQLDRPEDRGAPPRGYWPDEHKAPWFLELLKTRNPEPQESPPANTEGPEKQAGDDS